MHAIVPVLVAALACAIVKEASADGSKGKCYKYGERCMGAPGYPEVKWRPCCQGYACTMTKEGKWGQFCQGIESYDPVSSHGTGEDNHVEETKCYSYGERCMGAPGYESVPYLNGCCTGYACTMTKEGEWGKFCQGIEPYEPVTSSGEESNYRGSGKKCYNYGERCMGESGYEAVPYLEGCCSGLACTMKKPGEWGSFCQGIEPYEPVTQH